MDPPGSDWASSLCSGLPLQAGLGGPEVQYDVLASLDLAICTTELCLHGFRRQGRPDGLGLVCGPGSGTSQNKSI